MNEVFDRVIKKLEEEITLLMQEREEAEEYDDEQIIFATDNQIRAFDYALRVIEEEVRKCDEKCV